MEKYRIENIQSVNLNGRPVTLFKAFEYDPDSHAYIFIGQFQAPARTAKKNLGNFITRD
uniref:Uncharacterized protein n=1 Tax=viral metagenome TaxID=1070528 RepID=A0A6M3LP32_9ZZZZ